MVRLRLAAPITVLMLTLAGCGGSKVVVQEVPGDPVQLTVPGNAAALAPQATATPTVSATPTPTSTATGTSTTPSTSSSTGTSDSSGGTTAPSTGTDSATNDTPPPAGSNAQQFENFCAQNPGAC